MYTALQLAEKILEETKTPMGPDEIWGYAVEHSYDKQTSLHGKTPWNTIGAQIYTAIKQSDDSPFVKISDKPPKFGLRSIAYKGDVIDPVKVTDLKNKTDDGPIERDLHPLLVSYVYSDDNFKGYSKTIRHENSSKSRKNAEKWMHPDIVAVNFPFDDLGKESIDLAKYVGIDTIRIFSFEMKRNVNDSNVREYYFQAVSNSSWANEGYLVAPRFSQGALMQLSRLNASFGIGVIRLDLDDVHQSEILFPSRDNDLDIGMIDDLVRINPDFKDFISTVNASMQLNHVIELGSAFDRVMKDDELKGFIERKMIKEQI